MWCPLPKKKSAAGASDLGPQHLLDLLCIDEAAGYLVLAALDCFSTFAQLSKSCMQPPSWRVPASSLSARPPNPGRWRCEQWRLLSCSTVCGQDGSTGRSHSPSDGWAVPLSTLCGGCLTLARPLPWQCTLWLVCTYLGREPPACGPSECLQRHFQGECSGGEMAAPVPALLGWPQTLCGSHSHMYAQGTLCLDKKESSKGTPWGPSCSPLLGSRRCINSSPP